MRGPSHAGKAPGEDRVKSLCRKQYFSTTMILGRTTFCQVPFPYGFCSGAAIISFSRGSFVGGRGNGFAGRVP